MSQSDETLLSVWTWSVRPPCCHSVRDNHRKQLVVCLSNYTQTSTKRELKLMRRFRKEAACRTQFFSGSAALKIGEHRRSVAESDEQSGRPSSSRDDEVTVKLQDLVGAD